MKSRGKVGAEVWVSAALFSISLNTPYALIYPNKEGEKKGKGKVKSLQLLLL